ncbi:hypothetical protein QYE76_015621 [Lolium multiflorum]|uniref:Reverse transcriptase Ty1/copia-type domain-containing protein n=1 Tax=Lolium multiflorum TaxID=4521 RepID=A0AAD8U8G0_LOLMU|nr:hypothetical protein QYE76_015621 [Lolium multiflorum]
MGSVSDIVASSNIVAPAPDDASSASTPAVTTPFSVAAASSPLTLGTSVDATPHHPMVTRAGTSIHGPNLSHADGTTTSPTTPTQSPLQASVPTLDRYKARWTVRVFTQCACVDFGETFSPIVKSTASLRWPVHRLDVRHASLQGVLLECIYCKQPTVYVDADLPDHVCLPLKSLYGLKLAPWTWHTCINDFLWQLGFVTTLSDTSMFVVQHGADMAYLLLSVDHIVLTASTPAFLCSIIDRLSVELKMKDLGPSASSSVSVSVARMMVSSSTRGGTPNNFSSAPPCPTAR